MMSLQQTLLQRITAGDRERESGGARAADVINSAKSRRTGIVGPEMQTFEREELRTLATERDLGNHPSSLDAIEDTPVNDIPRWGGQRGDGGARAGGIINSIKYRRTGVVGPEMQTFEREELRTLVTEGIWAHKNCVASERLLSCGGSRA